MQTDYQPVILNVDDDEIGRYATTKILKKAGFRVIESANGLDAVRLASDSELIVLDVNLPDISGFEVCRRIKSDPTTSHIPVLHLSATYHDTDSTEQGLEMGAEAYLTHPVEPRVLIAYVKSLLRAHSLETELVKSKRALMAITACHKAMLRAQDDVELTSDVCRTLVEIGRYSMVWVGYAERNESGAIRPVAFSGQGGGFFDKASLVWLEGKNGCEPTGAAIRTAKPAKILLVPDAPDNEPWMLEAIRRGYRSSLAIPLMYLSKPFGAVTFYSQGQDEFSEERIVFLSQLADDLSYGISNIRIREVKKSAEEAVRESAEKYRLLFSKESDAVILIDSETHDVMDANEAAEKIYGYTREELLGAKVSMFYADPAKVPDRRELFNEAGNATIVDGLHRKKDGTVFPVEISSGHFTWKGKTIICEIIRDVTERQKAALEKEELKWQLFQSQKLEALGTLVGGIAHDLNNMLQVILGYSQIMLSGKSLHDPNYEDLQRIVHSAEQQAELVKSLLMYARKAPTNKVPVELNRQIEQMTDMLFRSFPKMIDIDLDLDANLYNVIADPSQINQVIMNLAINAKEAMQDQGRLGIETRNVTLGDDYARSPDGAKPGKYVMLLVSDTGKGMDEQTLSRMFDPFFSTKQRGSERGTGMGLCVVKGITEEHDGYISCESMLGKGTTFRVFFPAHNVVEKLDARSEEALEKHGTGTILLIDDEPALIDLGTRVLNNAGYSVVQANNGIEAIELFKMRKDEISLVILDLIMPKMSGMECLRELAKIDPSVKVIIVTGISLEESMMEELGPLICGIVKKPFKMSELNIAVHKVLSSN